METSASKHLPSQFVRPHDEQAQFRMPCLDGLRGLAAIMVLLGHAADFGLPSFVDGSASHDGVLIFFALSGFLMGRLYLLQEPTAQKVVGYAVARSARIVPIYYLIVTVSFFLYRQNRTFVYAVTPMQLIRLLSFNGSVSVFWSIGPEVQFYVIFVALWFLRAWLRQDALFAILVTLVAAVCLAMIRHWPGIFIASKFHIFSLGMLLALLRDRLPHLTRPIIFLGHGVAIVVLAIFLLPNVSSYLLGSAPFNRATDPAYTSFYSSIDRVILAAYLALAFSFDSPVLSAMFANRLAALLGRYSFSIYLLHVVVLANLVHGGLPTTFPPALMTLTAIAITVLLASISFRFVERPAGMTIRRLLLPAPRGIAS